MRKFFRLIVPMLLSAACGKEGGPELQDVVYGPDGEVYHEMIVLGKRLDNPYRTETVRRAYSSLYPTKSRTEIETTDLYVRFLPKDESEYDLLADMGVTMLDHPVDFEILKEGDYYHDPSVSEGEITWQYAVVPHDFKFPSVRYEVISECFIAENSPQTRALEDVDWEAVEMEAYRMTGNEDMFVPQTKASRNHPKGRITIVDDDANGGKPFGVAGVRVSCNVFVKFSHAYTDRDGYYEIPKTFSAKPRYRLVFKNEKGFAIGFNLLLVPASVSTLGKGSSSGMSYTITRDSDSKLFRRAVVNNSAYEYITRCASDDMGIRTPPGDLRIWLFSGLSASSAVMIHHGAFVSQDFFSKYLGVYSSIIQFFAPDITLGMDGKYDYRSIYDATCHELAHASHFSQVGKGYWDKYIMYILKSYLKSGGTTYGDGTEGDNAGHCEVGEMWAYYVESMMHKERYGGAIPTYGTSYWFYPQIFRYLEERGLSRSEIFAALTGDVSGKAQLQQKLVTLYPGRKTIIEQVFNRYK